MAILAKLLLLAENILSPFESSHDIVPRELKGTMDMEMAIVNDFCEEFLGQNYCEWSNFGQFQLAQLG